VEEIATSKFKATCLSVLEQVRKTKKPILVTRFGKPVAQIWPPPPPRPKRRANWIGDMEGAVIFLGDVTSPAAPLEEWDAWR